MTPAEQFQVDRVKKSLGDKVPGALVEVKADDLAAIAGMVLAVFGLDRATREIVASFAKGAAGVKPHQAVFVLAEQLRQVLAELEPVPAPAVVPGIVPGRGEKK